MGKFSEIRSCSRDFEDFLQYYIAKDSGVLDDGLPDYVSEKITELSSDEIMELAQAWGDLLYEKGKLDGTREFVDNLP